MTREHRLHLHRRNARRLGMAFWVNAVLGVGWLLMMPVIFLTGLKASVPFLAEISAWALVVGHMSSALAALAGKGAHETAETIHAPDVEPGP